MMNATAAGDPAALTIVMSGASGLIGGAISRHLTARGHRVIPLVRHRPGGDQLGWDPDQNRIDAQGLNGCDGVVHLAGESIAKRWTAAQMNRVMASRERGTTLISRTIASLANPPRVLLSASAIGIYGDRGDELLAEDARVPGQDSESFLARVCTVWEGATAPAAAAGIRVAQLRTGIVLTTAGGALKPMLIPFRLGLGGRIGSGRQWMSWITLDDLVAAYAFVLLTPELHGPVNGVAPNPVVNREFARLLGEVLHRPALIPAPATALRLAMGRMADELLLYSQRVIPDQLEKHGFGFKYPDLKPALVHLLSQ
jgi:hypothetical protein